MKIIAQCGVLFLICLGGIFVARLCPFPVPSSVLSMLFLFLLLLAKVIRPEFLRETTEFLTGNMAFFFIPSSVGILAYADRLRGEALAMLTICAVAGLVTFLTTAFSVLAVIRLQHGRGTRRGR